MSLWTADANHFTVDDNVNHTADGWHNDDEGRAGAGDGRKRYRKSRFNIAQLRHEDEMILSMIKRFMNRI